MPYHIVTIQVLVDTDGAAEACDAIAEAIRPMLREFKPEYPTAWIDWRYASFDPAGCTLPGATLPVPHDGAGFEYAYDSPAYPGYTPASTASMPGKRIIATFHPQAWVNNYAVEVDPEGPTEWDVTDAVLALGRDKALALKDDQNETDELRSGAPSWIADWSGPFYVEVEQAIEAYFEG